MRDDGGIKYLSLLICKMFAEQRASNRAGVGACAAVWCSSMIDSGVSKEQALETMSSVWDIVAKEHAKLHGTSPRGEDFTFEYSPQVRAQMEADPELAAAMKDMQAQMREALDGVATGRFASVDEAFTSLGAERVDIDDLDDDDD